MANWVPRSPQGLDCEIEAECQSSQESTQDVAATPDVAQTGSTDLGSVASTYEPASTAAGAQTTAVLTSTAIQAEIPLNANTASISASPTQTTIITTTTPASASVTEPPSLAEATSKSSSNDGVSKGAVAGIAIATCIAGAAIAFAIAFLLFKRRDKRLIQKTCPSGYPVYADSSPELVMMQKSAATGSPYVQVSQTQMRTPVPVPARVPVPAPQPSANADVLAGIVPPAADEDAVQTRVAGLFGDVHRHVDTYYRDVHASITPSMDSDLAAFGKDVDMLELLQNCSSPTVALKHALVEFVLGVTGPKSEDDEPTLWPDELAHVADADRATSGNDSGQIATARALHRRLSVYLYTRANSPTPHNHSHPRLSNLSTLSLTRKTSSAIREAAEHFSLTFFPWANPTFGDQERETDLAGIIAAALECRIWLHGQAGEWDFKWEAAGLGAVVVAPALVVSESGDARGKRVVLDQSVVKA